MDGGVREPIIGAQLKAAKSSQASLGVVPPAVAALTMIDGRVLGCRITMPVGVRLYPARGQAKSTKEKQTCITNPAEPAMA